VLELPRPDGVLSAADVKDVVADVIGQLPLQGIEGRALDSGDIWPVVTMASVNQSSVWEVTSQTDDTPCDETVMDWLHTLQCEKLEMAANILFRHLALTRKTANSVQRIPKTERQRATAIVPHTSSRTPNR